MAEALILDSEAISALASPSSRGASFNRARALLAVAHQRNALVRVPSPVLAEVCRGTRFDAPIDLLLNGKGILVTELTAEMARVAGHNLARLKLSSEHAVDAFVVATAASFAHAVIATSDPDDIGKLAAPFRHIEVYAL